MVNYKFPNYIIELPNENESIAFGKRLALCVRPPLVFAFTGDLGMGKTAIIRALVQGLGVESPVKSPTFSLVESYHLPTMHIHHFDLYRINDEEELDYLGFRDYFTDDSLCAIEWAEKANQLVPYIDLQFTLSLAGAGRQLHLMAKSDSGKTILEKLKGE
ncbi:MAG: tRNA (adenosine(37)-N6)-threonylcarbamoyltransferase complex ATPase subunit type 1 TsaE [Legionella sp. 40-6]|nr:tRNA (adenosine(37)-N6)-threonylcarbamoyltransferase complex ATPase subunit type 1 TsaE [Legionella sp.]OJY26261.1 MAG: tRNA (adenosine(37)-N6)-threonylcarbamoyltransferase complex ATPase subunit type 1 TsaE [Legionella sp. 40-6]